MSFFSILSIYRDNDITDILDETFITTEERFRELVTTNLKPGCAETPVTDVNKKDYVDSVAASRISRRVKEQFDASMKDWSMRFMSGSWSY